MTYFLRRQLSGSENQGEATRTKLPGEEELGFWASAVWASVAMPAVASKVARLQLEMTMCHRESRPCHRSGFPQIADRAGAQYHGVNSKTLTLRPRRIICAARESWSAPLPHLISPLDNLCRSVSLVNLKLIADLRGFG